MTLEDRLIEERAGDEGLSEARKRREDPKEAKRNPEKVKVHSGPTGVPVSVADEGEEEPVKDGIFKDKLEKSREMGGYARRRGGRGASEQRENSQKST